MKFNINTQIVVTLTAQGAEILERELGKLPNQLRPDVRFKEGSVYKEQAWVLMQIFGPHICMGMQPFKNCEVDIPDDPRITEALNILSRAETCEGPHELFAVAVDARRALQK